MVSVSLNTAQFHRSPPPSLTWMNTSVFACMHNHTWGRGGDRSISVCVRESESVSTACWETVIHLLSCILFSLLSFLLTVSWSFYFLLVFLSLIVSFFNRCLWQITSLLLLSPHKWNTNLLSPSFLPSSCFISLLFHSLLSFVRLPSFTRCSFFINIYTDSITFITTVVFHKHKMSVV